MNYWLAAIGGYLIGLATGIGLAYFIRLIKKRMKEIQDQEDDIDVQ